MTKILRNILLGAALCTAGVTTIEAIPVVGASVFVSTTGEVIATYRGNSASFSNDLYLDSPTGFSGIIFNNHASTVGSSVSLGTFTAGTELVFRLFVNNTQQSYFTGPASRNPDGFAHAQVDDEWSATETLVEFEDLFGGPFHFNDLSFSFSNVQATEPPPTGVPEAGATALLLGLGFAGLMGWKRRHE